MPENVQSVSSVGLNPNTNLIVKKQQEYNSAPIKESLEQDVVEIHGKTSEQKLGLKEYAYITSGIVATGLAIAGVIFGHKKIKEHQAKKEAQRLAQEAREKAQKIWEENQRKAKEAAETQAKLKAEREAKIKAQKEAEAKAKAEAEKKRIEREKELQRIAREEAIHKAEIESKESLNEILGLRLGEDSRHFSGKVNEDSIYFYENGAINFEKLKNDINNNRYDKGSIYRILWDIHSVHTKFSEKEISKEIIEQIKTLENAGADFDKIKKMITNMHLIGDSEIAIIKRMAADGKQQSMSTVHRIKTNNEKFQYIINKFESENPKDGESASDFVKRLLNDFDTKKETERLQHIKDVHSKIKYTDEPCIEYFANDPNYFGPYHGAAEKYTSFEGQDWDNEEYRKIFSTFPRYKSHIGNYANDERNIAKEYNGVKPLTRWISTPQVEFDAKTGHLLHDTYGYRTSEDFMKNFEVGKEYVIPHRQSCSKKFKYVYGDNNYGDYASDFDIKFIFIPKSKNGSRAVDLLDCGYKGHDCEALYLPGEKFVVLDKRIEEVVREHKEIGEQYRTFYRWVIEMQEK